MREIRVTVDHSIGMTACHPSSGDATRTMTKVDGKDLQAEVERLRAENETLQRRIAWRDRARRASAWALLVLGCGLAVLALVAVWLRATLLDTDRYVDTVAPIAADADVQNAVAGKLETAIFTRIDFDALAREVLPDRAQLLAPAIERGVQGVISDRLHEFTASDRFQELWTDANRRAHTRVVELLEGGRSGRLALREDTVYLDLSAAVDRVKGALQERGLTRIASAIPPTVDGQVVLFRSSALVDAQRAVRLLKAVSIVLPLLALLCLAGAVLLTRPRRRGLMRAGIGVAISMVLLIGLLAIARSVYLDALNTETLPRDAASEIFDTVVAFLRAGVRIVVVVAVLVALITFLAGLPLRAYAERGWTAFATSRRRRWVAAHRNALMLTAGGLGMLLLLVWDPLTGGTVLVVAVLVGAALGVIAALAAGAEPAEPPAEPGGIVHSG
jgi:hypothetical protein